MNPEITIDGIKITLLKRFLLMGAYKCILYTLTEDTGIQKYIAYKSKSEGLWRLCWFDNHDRTMKKGDDYITTTQIHMGLQCFFESNYETLPEATDNNELGPYLLQENIPEDPTRMKRILDALLPIKKIARTSRSTSSSIHPSVSRAFSKSRYYSLNYPNEVERVYREAVYPVFKPLLALIRP